MADITMCNDKQCPLKDKCYRFTAPANPYRQSYFYNLKETTKDGGTDKCPHFWDNKSN